MSFDLSPHIEEVAGGELEAESLLSLPLRVWVELGRARLPASTVVGMTEGAIVDLDREPDEPADLFVNGRHLGTGRLILVDGEWALRIETLDVDVDEHDFEHVSSDGQDGEGPVD